MEGKQAPVNFNILLRQINAIRAAGNIGDSLSAMPHGEMGNGFNCPIARALSNGLTGEVDGHDTTLRAKKNQAARYDFPAIAKALRAAGFKKVTIESESWDEERYDYISDSVSFKTSKTMRNFIERFDEAQFKDLILGGYRPQDDDEDDDA